MVAQVDKVLKGAAPKDIPIVQASRFELIVNQKTAKPDAVDERPYPIELPVPKSTTIRTKGFRRLFSESDEIGYSS